jgi:predicted negative regulator of RcsB-dependent stress response
MLNFRFDTTLFQASVAHNRLGLFEDSLDIQRFLETRASGTMAELNHLETGRTLYEKTDYPGARNKLAQFLQQYPESVYDADARMLLARVYRKNKEFSKALKNMIRMLILSKRKLFQSSTMILPRCLKKQDIFQKLRMPICRQ